MQEWLIYQHINKKNNKSYIGQTCNLKRRIGLNGSGYLTKNPKGEYRQIAFASAILKYGWDNFETKILKEHLTLDEANYYESFYIEKYQTYKPKYGYNIRKGGNNASPSEETRKKIGEAQRHISEKERKRRSEVRKGQKLSEETKKKISAAVSGEKHPMYGKHHTKEAKEKISEFNKTNSCFVINNPRKRQVICVETGEIFNSCKEAQQHFCPTATHRKTVADACRKGSKARSLNNMHFKYLEEYKKELEN